MARAEQPAQALKLARGFRWLLVKGRILAIACCLYLVWRGGEEAFAYFALGGGAVLAALDLLRDLVFEPTQRKAIERARLAGIHAAMSVLPTMRCECGHLGTEHVIDVENPPHSPGSCLRCTCSAARFNPP